MNIEQLLPLAASIARSLKRDDNLCPACLPQRVLALEWHHIVPQNLWPDSDSPQVHICGSCHVKIHNAALKVSRHQPADELTKVQSILVKLIVRAMFADNPNEAENPRHIMFKVTDAELKRLHMRKKDSGYSNLIDYVKSLVLRDLKNL